MLTRKLLTDDARRTTDDIQVSQKLTLSKLRWAKNQHNACYIDYLNATTYSDTVLLQIYYLANVARTLTDEKPGCNL